MSRKIQRNEPCPCGSGKKYKQCCMQKERDHAIERASNREGVQLALGWLSKQHRPEIDQWVEDVWLADIDQNERHGIATADPRIRSIHDINLLEFLVAEGSLSIEDEAHSPLQMILASDALPLSDSQRAYIVQLAQRPLRLYRVSACDAGASFSLQPYPSDNGDAITIEDKWASRMFDVGDIVGLRLMQSAAGWETSGAIYHIPNEYIDDLLPRLEKAEENDYSRTLSHFWLQLVAAHA